VIGVCPTAALNRGGFSSSTRPAVADALAFLLKGYGYETVVARDVDNARELLESESIDGVVTDPLSREAADTGSPSCVRCILRSPSSC
jgi:hypothetical protein